MNPTNTPFMRQTVLDLEESRIREVANAGLGRSDVLAFWFGESDEVTPDVVRQAAIESLQRGETFYAHNLGLPELRQAVAACMNDLHGQNHGIGMDRIAITSGGVNALMLAFQALVDAGDLTLFQPRAGPLGRFNVLGQRLAIFEPDHSSSPLSLLKIAETFFDNTSNAAVSARALSLRRNSRSSILDAPAVFLGLLRTDALLRGLGKRLLCAVAPLLQLLWVHAVFATPGAAG